MVEVSTMKKCAICKEDKDPSEFNKHKHRADGLQTVCRPCNRARSRKYYNENKEYHKKVIVVRNISARQKARDYIASIKTKCSICDEVEKCCLEFHHIDPSKKEHTVSRLLASNPTISTIQKEVDKCIILCANCHRKLHAGLITLP